MLTIYSRPTPSSRFFTHAYGRPSTRREIPDEEDDSREADWRLLTEEELYIVGRLFSKLYGVEWDQILPDKAE